MERFLLNYLEISLTTSIVILGLILLGSLINKRYVAKWKYGLWIVLALWLIIPVSYRLPESQIQITIPAEVGRLAVTEFLEITPQNLEIQPPENQALGEMSPMPQAATPMPVDSNVQEKTRISLTLLQALAYLWTVVTLGLMLWHLVSFVHYKRSLMKGGRTVENPVLLEQLEELCRELHIRKRVALIVCEQVSSPMAVGILRPVLALPGEEYTREESFYILKHELIHLKRHDVLVKFLLLLARDLHWFNPVIYLMHREAAVDMELACDEAVVKGSSYEQRRAYMETLLVTLHRQQIRVTHLSTQFSGGTRIMKKRFHNILSKANKRNGVILFAVILLLTVSITALVGCAMEEAPAPDMSGAEEVTGSLSSPDGNGEVIDLAPEEEMEKLKGLMESLSAKKEALEAVDLELEEEMEDLKDIMERLSAERRTMGENTDGERP